MPSKRKKGKEIIECFTPHDNRRHVPFAHFSVFSFKTGKKTSCNDCLIVVHYVSPERNAQWKEFSFLSDTISLHPRWRPTSSMCPISNNAHGQDPTKDHNRFIKPTNKAILITFILFIPSILNDLHTLTVPTNAHLYGYVFHSQLAATCFGCTAIIRELTPYYLNLQQ